MGEIQIEIIRSNRKTMTLEVRRDGRVVVRAPYRMSRRQIELFVQKKSDWIRKHRQQMAERNEQQKEIPKLTGVELQQLADQAREDIPKRVSKYAPLVGVTYGRITIRNQKTRWGSCSAKGNLNFNCLLMLAPEEVRDYVVVHELCHRLEMNHSERFWTEVRRVLPDYREREHWLKEHGSDLMYRVAHECNFFRKN